MDNTTFNLSNIASCLKNIPSRIHSTTPHFTGEGKIMPLSPKNITSRFENITLCCSITILCLLNTTFLTGSIFGISLSSNNDNASALSYSTDQDISFTFAPKLSISLSDTNLVIDNLVPGQTSASNAITITVASNTPYGYSLYADAGSNDTESIYYSTSSLVHNDTTTDFTPSFTSIATNASLTTLDTDNTWGYSTSTDNGTTWSTYNGLPSATSTDSSTSTSNPALLIDTKDPADSSKSIALKVAARASTTQASGTYSNIINFYAVGKPQVFYMQDTTAIKSKLKNTGDELQAIDTRDGKEYWVAKLADGNIWMTQNLDLDIDSTKTYTPVDTDIPTEWIPARSTTTDTTWDNSNTGTNVPYSYDPGSLYWDGNVTTNGSNNFSTNTVTNPSATPGGTHYHIGNYYNWTAAVAMNDSSSYIGYQIVDVNQSICPAGWRLSTFDGDKSYYGLANAQNFTAGTSGNMQLNPTYFVYGSYWSGRLWYLGSSGNYWYGGVASSSNYSTALYFSANGLVESRHSFKRQNGFSLRCVIR